MLVILEVNRTTLRDEQTDGQTDKPTRYAPKNGTRPRGRVNNSTVSSAIKQLIITADCGSRAVTKCFLVCLDHAAAAVSESYYEHVT